MRFGLFNLVVLLVILKTLDVMEFENKSYNFLLQTSSRFSKMPSRFKKTSSSFQKSGFMDIKTSHFVKILTCDFVNLVI